MPSILTGLAMQSPTERGSSNSKKACDVAAAPAALAREPPEPEGGGLEGRIATLLILPNCANVARTEASVAPAGIPRMMTVFTGALAAEEEAEAAPGAVAAEEGAGAAAGVAVAVAVAAASEAGGAEGALLAVAACGGRGWGAAAVAALLLSLSA